MFFNINSEQLSLKQRIRIIASQNHQSDSKAHTKPTDPKFRLTQRLTRPSQIKIKSQGLSPDQIRNNSTRNRNIISQPKKQLNQNLNQKLKKNLTQRTQSESQKNNHFIFNPAFQFRLRGGQWQNIQAGRTIVLKNGSPDRFKIKTNGLINNYPQVNKQKQIINTQKCENKNQHLIHFNRKYSLNNDKQKVQDNINQDSPRKLKYANYVKNQNDMNKKIESREKMDKVILVQNDSQKDFTQFQKQEINKFHLYYKGKRRITHRTQFTDVQGNPVIQKGDSVAFRYQVIEEIGRGAFGKVYKCKDHKKNEIVALKIIVANSKLTKQAKIQIEILEKAIQNDSQSRHNIVRIKGSFIFRSHTCIAYELLDCNLYEYLKLNKFRSTPQNTLVKISIQVLHALSFLYNNKIVHCDIKPQNIMLKEAKKTGVRLIDMGSSCYQDQQYYTYIQSRYYRAPQVILGLRYTTAIDIWSFGCVLAQLYTGYPLFPGQTEEEQLLMYIQLLGSPPIGMLQVGKRRKRFFNENFQCRIPQSPQKYRLAKGLTFEKALSNSENKLFIQFIKRCIQWDPNKRIKPKQALLDDWILSGIPNNIRARHIVQVTGEGVSF